MQAHAINNPHPGGGGETVLILSGPGQTSPVARDRRLKELDLRLEAFGLKKWENFLQSRKQQGHYWKIEALCWEDRNYLTRVALVLPQTQQPEGQTEKQTGK